MGSHCSILFLPSPPPFVDHGDLLAHHPLKESLHSEGVLELSKMCCFAVSQLLMLGKSIISNASKVPDEDGDEDSADIDWPDDSFEKAKIIRTKVQSMTGFVEAVSNSFITEELWQRYPSSRDQTTIESIMTCKYPSIPLDGSSSPC
nr:hypothetical protein CFP56_57981 [Quercus suber]